MPSSIVQQLMIVAVSLFVAFLAVLVLAFFTNASVLSTFAFAANFIMELEAEIL